MILSAFESQTETPPLSTVAGPSGPAEPPKMAVERDEAVLTIDSLIVMPWGVRWNASRTVWKLLLGVLYQARRWTRK